MQDFPQVLLIFVIVNVLACFAIDDFPELEYVRTKIACQNETIYFNCSSPSLLEIKAASFGRGMSVICANGVNADRLCDLIDKKAVVKEICDFKAECEVIASEEKFGNDCPEVDKYLNIIYACVRNPEKPTPQPIMTSNTTVNHTSLPIVTTTTEPTSPPTTPTTARAVLTSRPSAKTKPQSVITFNPNGPDLDFLTNTAHSYRDAEIYRVLIVAMVTMLIIKL